MDEKGHLTVPRVDTAIDCGFARINATGKGSDGWVLDWLETVGSIPDCEPTCGWTSWMEQALQSSRAPMPPSLKNLFSTVSERMEPTDEMGRYLSQLWPLARDIALAKGTGVRIMTLGAQGLTVEAAIIVSLENGVVPMDQRELGEERRLLYVGMTRV